MIYLAGLPYRWRFLNFLCAVACYRSPFGVLCLLFGVLCCSTALEWEFNL